MIYQSLKSSQHKSAKSAQPARILPNGGKLKDCVVEMPWERLRVRTPGCQSYVCCSLAACSKANPTVSLGTLYLTYKMRGVETEISKDTSTSMTHSYLIRERRDFSSRCCSLVRIHTPERPVNRRVKKVRDNKWECLTGEKLQSFHSRDSFQVSQHDLQGKRHTQPKLNKGSTLVHTSFPGKVPSSLTVVPPESVGGL